MMQDMLTLAGANLLTPMILCFALGCSRRWREAS
jgi:hypothetical protein